MKTFLFAVLFTSSHAFGAGFEGGNSFRATEIEGRISITCRDISSGRQDYVSAVCRDEILEPNEFRRFTAELGIVADEVVLSALWENGTVREKTAEFDSATGVSGEFNLWIRTLLQRPLLHYGKNRVTYTLKNDGATVRSGEFTAEVLNGEKRVCGSRYHFHSPDMQDCMFPEQKCRQYFSMYDYCR